MDKTQIEAPQAMPQIVITQEFAAPRALVFRAYTDPELLVRWLGPRETRMRIECYDVRDGGRWRYIHTDDQGNVYTFRGVFHGDPSLDSIVQTFEYEGTPGRVSLQTTTFTEVGARTRVRTASSYQSVSDRDAMIASGMERGIHDSADRLAILIADLTTS
jgi:uncharacterized protein YndB with AHSA1/START domain